jgi:large subunit ribosomal protein L22
MPIFTAKLSFAKMTPRKMRYMADLIRGRNVNVALSMLKVQDKRSGRYFFKLLKSAIAIAAQTPTCFSSRKCASIRVR